MQETRISSKFFVKFSHLGHNGAVTANNSGHGLGPTRARVLRFLLAQHGYSSVAEIASALSLHANTIRFHLEALTKLGYVAEKREEPKGQGRPRRMYCATQEAPEVDTSHLRDLTQVLLRHIVASTAHPKQVTEEIGHSWGKDLAHASQQDLRSLTDSAPGSALDELISHTREMGFDGAQTGEHTVTFTSCPYRAINQPMLSNICAIHFGLLRGFLDEADAPVELRELTPGTSCIAQFQNRKPKSDN